MYRIQYTDNALKDLKKTPIQWKKRIVKAIDGLSINPFSGKKLQGQLEGIYSLRVWPYRILYRIHQKEILVFILAVGHRQSVYN